VGKLVSSAPELASGTQSADLSKHPVSDVRWVPIEQVEPNDYNPNSVARIEMGLLLTSILHDGYTQPVVTIYDADRDKYVIVDGFHRYYVMLTNEQVRASTGGLLPIVVIDKTISERMASTVRHNRARGKHSVQGMSSMVFKMLDDGMTDAQVCNELGMEPEELLRLKHITGFSKLFADREYNKSWVTRSQIRVRQEYETQAPEGA
jgi:ParB-like chromosome segregation protein Spo0J